MITDVIIDTGCYQKCENDIETSNLLAVTSSGCTTWLQKLNMFSFSESVAGSRCVYTTQWLCCWYERLWCYDTSHCILDARVNATLAYTLLRVILQIFYYFILSWFIAFKNYKFRVSASDVFVYICEYTVFILMKREYAKSFLLTFNLLSINFFVLIIKF